VWDDQGRPLTGSLSTRLELRGLPIDLTRHMRHRADGLGRAWLVARRRDLDVALLAAFDEQRVLRGWTSAVDRKVILELGARH
jgi:hypothetical protein